MNNQEYPNVPPEKQGDDQFDEDDNNEISTTRNPHEANPTKWTGQKDDQNQNRKMNQPGARER